MRHDGDGYAAACALLMVGVLAFASCASDPHYSSGSGGDDDIYRAREEHKRRMREMRDYPEAAAALAAPDPASPAGAPADLSSLPVKMVRVEVIRSQTRGTNERHKAIGGGYAGKNVTVVKPAPAGGLGVNYQARHGQGFVDGNVGKSANMNYSNATSYITVMDGGTGYLNIGSEGTEVQQVGDFAVLSRRESGHRLAVRTQVLPNGLIQVTVYPVWMKYDRRLREQKYEELGTTVVVRGGQSFSIGGLDRSGRETREQLFARKDVTRIDSTSIVLRATVLN